MENGRNLILENSLQAFFLDKLLELNRKTSHPLPTEAIYYSSQVMDRFGESEKYFELIEGKVREKTLGLKLMETSLLSIRRQKRELKDIGDTALLLCGFFSDSLNSKMVDAKYYQDVGQMAYHRLNTIVPSVYEIPRFYKKIAASFEFLSSLMRIIQQESFGHFDMQVSFIINKKVS